MPQQRGQPQGRRLDSRLHALIQGLYVRSAQRTCDITTLYRGAVLSACGALQAVRFCVCFHTLSRCWCVLRILHAVVQMLSPPGTPPPDADDGSAWDSCHESVSVAGRSHASHASAASLDATCGAAGLLPGTSDICESHKVTCSDPTTRSAADGEVQDAPLTADSAQEAAADSSRETGRSTSLEEPGSANARTYVPPALSLIHI